MHGWASTIEENARIHPNTDRGKLKQRLRSDQKLKLAVLSAILRPDPAANLRGVTFESFRRLSRRSLGEGGHLTLE
jgi:hypothetical protein